MSRKQTNKQPPPPVLISQFLPSYSKSKCVIPQCHGKLNPGHRSGIQQHDGRYFPAVSNHWNKHNQTPNRRIHRVLFHSQTVRMLMETQRVSERDCASATVTQSRCSLSLLLWCVTLFDVKLMFCIVIEISHFLFSSEVKWTGDEKTVGEYCIWKYNSICARWLEIYYCATLSKGSEIILTSSLQV